MDLLALFTSYLEMVKKRKVDNINLEQLKQEFHQQLAKDKNFGDQVYQLIDKTISNPIIQKLEKSRWLAYELEVNPKKILDLTDEQKNNLSNYYLEQGFSKHYLNQLIELYKPRGAFEVDILEDIDDPNFVQNLLRLSEEEQIIWFQLALERKPEMIHRILDNTQISINKILYGMSVEHIVPILRENPEVSQYLTHDFLLWCCNYDLELQNILPSSVLLSLIVSYPGTVNHLIGEYINDKSFLLDLSLFSPEGFVTLLNQGHEAILLETYEHFNPEQKKYWLKWVLQNKSEAIEYIPIKQLQELLHSCSSDELVEFTALNGALLDLIPNKSHDKAFLLKLNARNSIHELMLNNHFYLSVLDLFSLNELVDLMHIDESKLKKMFCDTDVLTKLVAHPKQLEAAFKHKLIIFEDLDDELKRNISIAKAAISADMYNIQYIDEDIIEQADFLREVGLETCFMYPFFCLLINCLGPFIPLDWLYKVVPSVLDEKPNIGLKS